MQNIKYEKIINELIFWLEGIIEDDPLPYEIQYANFYFQLKPTCSLSVSFNETKKENYDFQPLEAQYFFYAKFIKLNSKSLNKKIAKFLVEEAIKSPALLNLFKNLKISVFFC